MSNTKTNYRNVFKSDHLGSIDLEEMQIKGQKMIFTIKEVKQYQFIPGDKKSGIVVAGRRISANIAHFTDPTIKPFVVNAGNSKTISGFANSIFVEDWSGISIQLYVDKKVKFGTETVSGIKVHPVLPVAKFPDFNPSNDRWNGAVEAIKNGTTTLEKLKKHYSITKENEKLLCL